MVKDLTKKQHELLSAMVVTDLSEARSLEQIAEELHSKPGIIRRRANDLSNKLGVPVLYEHDQYAFIADDIRIKVGDQPYRPNNNAVSVESYPQLFASPSCNPGSPDGMC